MKTLLTLALLALSPLCMAQKTIELEGFKNIVVGTDTKLTLVKSNQNKIVIEGNEEELRVKNEGGSLTIDGDGAATLYYNGKLDGIIAGTDCKVIGQDEISAGNFNLVAGSDTEIVLNITADVVTTAAGSDANVTLKGKVKKHHATVGSDATLNAKGLDTQDTDINVGSDGQASVTVKDNVNAVAGSDADIKIYGAPKNVKKTPSGDATITIVK